MRKSKAKKPNLTIDWVKEKGNLFIVKFKNIKTPITMNFSYYMNLKQSLG